MSRFESAITHLPFHGFHFSQPLDITLAAVESCPEERVREVGGEARADHLAAEAEDVHVVVLDALMRRVDVVADRRADAAHLRRGDRGADPRAADEDTPLGVAPLQRLAELARL